MHQLPRFSRHSGASSRTVRGTPRASLEVPMLLAEQPNPVPRFPDNTRQAETKNTRAIPGLSSREAEERLDALGPNELGIAKQKSWIRQVLPLLLNPLAIILLVSAIVAAVVGEVTSAIVIISVVLLGATI